MWVELKLPPRKLFLIHKKYIEETGRRLRPSRKLSLSYRALLFGRRVDLASFAAAVNLAIWALILTLVFVSKHFSAKFRFLDWVAWGILAFFVLATLFRINDALGDVMSRPVFRLRAGTLKAMLFGSTPEQFRAQGDKLIAKAASGGHPVTPWERFVWVFAGLVVSLLSLMFVLDLVPATGFLTLLEVLRIVVFMTVDLFFLGLPSAFFPNFIDTGEFGGATRILLELVKISLSLGVVAASISLWKADRSTKETYKGTVSNLHEYLRNYEPVKDGITIYECCRAPEEIPDTGIAGKTFDEIAGEAHAERATLQREFEAQIAAGQS